MLHTRTTVSIGVSSVVLAALAGIAGLTSTTASATVEPGTPARDVHIGDDDDNARNALIQPRGVTRPQHMSDTDILFGRANDDLLIGRHGSDTLLGGPGSDILVGGPDGGRTPRSDVSVGDTGDDIAIWGPGDGNDAFVANEGRDTMIFAPLVERANGSLVLTRHAGRKIPHVRIDHRPAYSCSIVKVPGSGFQFLVRFRVNGTPVATVRQKDVERVLCPSPRSNHVNVANLTVRHPAFRGVRLQQVGGTAGAILR